MARTDEAASGPAHAAPASARTLWGEPLKRLLLVAAVLFGISAALPTTLALRVPGLSVFDEATHADYAYQVAHGHIPAKGSVFSEQIRREASCHGFPQLEVPKLPACGSDDIPPENYPGKGENYNFSHPPLYYGITGVLAQVADTLYPGENFITAARLVGVLWLFAALLVLYLALRKFGTRWQIALSGAVLVACSPLVIYGSSTVSNDAVAPLAGSLALMMLARVLVDRRSDWLLPTVLAGLISATKLLNALPFLVIAVVFVALAVRAWRTERERARGLLLSAVGIIAAVGVVYLSWKVFQSGRGVEGWVSPIAGISTEKVRGWPLNELLSTTFSGIDVMSANFLPGGVRTESLTVWSRLIGPLGTAAIVTLLALTRPWSPRWTVAMAGVVGVISYPLVVEAQAYLAGRNYFPYVIPRYGIAIIPLIAAAIALVAEEKRMTKSMSVFAVISLLVVVRALANPF